VDIAGSRQFNRWYADRMAAELRDYLMDRGIAANRMALRQGTAKENGIRKDAAAGERQGAAITVRFFQ
jgi:ribosomal protein S19E (S16A)